MSAATRPSISSPRDDHRRYCHSPGGADTRHWGRPGDVRRCRHGRVQVGYEVLGTVPAYWRDLSRLLDPIRYRRAVRALEASA